MSQLDGCSLLTLLPVAGTVFALRVASLVAAASVALLLVISTAGYNLARYKVPLGSSASLWHY